MQRKIYRKLVEWKNQKCHKPLILNGVRQCGKTYILKEFGKNEFDSLAYPLHNYLAEHRDIHAVRFSMLPLKRQDNILNIPLYAVGENLFS